MILSTKTGLRLGDGPNDAGASRFRMLRAVDASLRRLRTDYIVRARAASPQASITFPSWSRPRKLRKLLPADLT